MLAGGKKEATLVNAMLLAQEAGLKVHRVPHVSLMPPHPILPWYKPMGHCALRGHPCRMQVLSGHLPNQVTASHGDTCPEPEGLLQVALQGTPHRVTGTVQGSTPVLRELNGVTFKQPAPLVGPLLIYRAKASETNTLPTLTGKLLESPGAREQPEGSPQSA